ncbi:hypothetical protein UA3_02544 [Enterococcus faecium EnGen0263]|uniref:DUF4352 domain-containing protein n=1 Tax=Enterococcus faecium TaxID=1352 RepID=UPI000330ACFA|nr:DUF4352 domain-containing protein [Enterococcus faecium]EOH52854.1 hypothetical protein UA3_02544 [Enterococcus faecium EnGen0263]
MRRNKIVISLSVLVVLSLIVFGGIFFNQHSNKYDAATKSVTAPNELKLTLKKSEEAKYLGKSKKNNLETYTIGIQNLGKSMVSLGAIDFKAELSNKKSIMVDPVYEAFYLDAQPGKTVKENLYFKVPKDKKVTKLIYQTDTNITVELDIK